MPTIFCCVAHLHVNIYFIHAALYMFVCEPYSYQQDNSYRFCTNRICFPSPSTLRKTQTHVHTHHTGQADPYATRGVSMVTPSSSKASSRGRVAQQPTNSIGHLVPAEVEVRGVGVDHRCGAVKRTNFLIVTNI